MLGNDTGFNYIDLKTLFGINNLVNIHYEWICSGVSTDTRTLSDGDLFIALEGENSDGHDRVAEAFIGSAAAAIVNRSWYEANTQFAEDMPLVLVEDTLTALGDLANFHRRKFDIPIIAVGGSNGKTTTKDMTSHVLSGKFNVLKTYGNYNNRIGVPLMLLQLSYEMNAAVLEMGTNEPGEMQILSRIVEPTHGIITNIGREHLEKLIDLDGVELEETSLFAYLQKHGGTCLINMDDERLRKYCMVVSNRFTFGQAGETGSAGNDLKASVILNGSLNPRIDFEYKGRASSASMKTAGYSTGLNALAALAVGLAFGMTPEEIIPRLESFEFIKTRGYARMMIDSASGVTLINDCYNANPDSMESAINTLKIAGTPGRKFAALGDMLELGESSLAEHIAIVKKAQAVADELFLFGPTMKEALEKAGNPSVRHYANKQEMAAEVIGRLQEGDVLLVKGSRGMRMEEIVEAFYKKFNGE